MERLTTEGERELWELSQEGDAGALRELIEANLDGIWPIARALARTGGKWGPEDLFQEGARAMVEFAERWRPMPGVPFAVAAKPRVRGAMKDFLRRRADAVRGQTEQPLSLDSSGSDPDGRTLGETLGADDEASEALDLSILRPLERAVIEVRILRRRPEPVKELAARLGKTPEQVVAAQARAMRRLMAAAA